MLLRTASKKSLSFVVIIENSLHLSRLYYKKCKQNIFKFCITLKNNCFRENRSKTVIKSYCDSSDINWSPTEKVISQPSAICHLEI
jgi:hypothetical protein